MTAPLRRDVTQSVALETIVALLRARLDLNDSQCFTVDDPEAAPPIPPGGGFFLTVAADAGHYPEGEQNPGNTALGIPSNLTEEGGFIVTAFNRVQLDQTGHAQQKLNAPRRGILKVKQNILWALIGQDPTTADNFTFLRETLSVLRSTQPTTVKHPDGGLTFSTIALSFVCDFDWSISEREE